MRRAAMLVVGCVMGLAGMAAGAEPAVGEKATFAYKTTDGKDVTPEAVKGRIVVFDFWATWCGPCMQMGPHMVELQKEYGEKGVSIIGVSLDNDAGKMAKVAKENQFTWPQICDGKGGNNAFAMAWGVRSIPHCVIIGPDATVLWSGHPARMDEPLRAAVAKYPYKPPVKEAAKPAAEKVAAPVAAEKPAPVGVAPAILDSRLAAADKAKEAKRDVEAYEGYKWVASRAADSEQGRKAQEKVAAYEADSAFVTAYKKVVFERDAASTLWLAKNLESNGKMEQAKSYYAKLVKDFPGTPSAETAKTALGRLK